MAFERMSECAGTDPVSFERGTGKLWSPRGEREMEELWML